MPRRPRNKERAICSTRAHAMLGKVANLLSHCTHTLMQEPQRRTRRLTPRELQRLHETLGGRSAKQLLKLVEHLAEAHPWLAGEVHAYLED